MTPNDYRALARLIKRTLHSQRREPGAALALDELVARIVEHFGRVDPAFDAAKFLDHCGGSLGVDADVR